MIQVYSKKFLQKLQKQRNSGDNDQNEEQKLVPHTQKLYQTSAKSTRFELLQKTQMNKLINQPNRYLLMKQKQEILLKRKREICLTNLNIMNEKEETERLEDFIENQQQSLKSIRLQFKNDCELINNL